MRKEKKNLYFHLKRCLRMFILLTVLGIGMFENHAIHAYAANTVPSLAIAGACADGTVTIQPMKGAEKQGYYELKGYQVTYQIERAAWTAFDERYGGYFYMGNTLNPSSGCSFYYAPSGSIWDNGAIQLGSIPDGTLIAGVNVDVLTGKVSCTFSVNSLDELPAYIAYCYQPASGAYIHRTEEYGNPYHVWYYQKLAGTPVQNMEQIDTEAPNVTVSLEPIGASVQKNGITWAKKFQMNIHAEDGKSGVEKVNVYHGQTIKFENSNDGQSKDMRVSCDLTSNGEYQIEAWDRFRHSSGRKSVVLNGVDTQSPVIQSLSAATTEPCRTNKITIVAKDQGVGLADKPYSWNGGAWSREAGYEVAQNGTYTVKVRDALGNESQKSIDITNIDKDAPVIISMTLKNTDFCKENTITVKAIDGGSGLAAKAYSWNGKAWTEQADYKIAQNGVYKVTVRDALGNESEKSITVTRVDNKPPVIERVEEASIKSQEVKITVTARDNEGGCGLAEKAYSFDEGKTWQKEPYTNINKNGCYIVWVRDALGSYSEKSIEVVSIKETPASDNREEKGEEKGEEKREEEKKVPNTNSNESVKKNEEHGNNGNAGSNGSGVISTSETTTGIPPVLSDGNEAYETETERSFFRPLTRRGNRKTVIIENEELLSEPEEVVESILEPQPVKQNSVQKVVVGALLGLLAAGAAALCLYLALVCLHYSCVLYGVDDKQNRHRITRLRLQRFDTDWKVEISEDKLGELGTGSYVLCFQPSFVKEETPSAVIIVIDGRSIRENLEDEILFRI